MSAERDLEAEARERERELARVVMEYLAELSEEALADLAEGPVGTPEERLEAFETLAAIERVILLLELPERIRALGAHFAATLRAARGEG